MHLRVVSYDWESGLEWANQIATLVNLIKHHIAILSKHHIIGTRCCLTSAFHMHIWINNRTKLTRLARGQLVGNSWSYARTR